MLFKDLDLSSPILKTLQEQNYQKPTSIQEKAIPPILNKQDILASAQTGTGKTAAFCIPIIQHLINSNERNNRKIKALIITPTRELAIQIGENCKAYTKYTEIKNTVIFGGVNQSTQTKAIKNGVDILIATPGRLLDLMNQGFINLNDIKYFVLDEADRMLDMGFINDIKKVIAKLPSKRQSLFFSATLPDNIVKLSKTILNNPQKIVVNPVSSTADTIQQHMYFTNKGTKKALLLHILSDKSIEQVLVFSKTKHGCDKIVKNLKTKNITSAAIHGDKAQNQRQKALTAFKSKDIRVLVATDIAARGIDIDKLKYVINYDIPNESETYVHRIGRSGRAGEEGIAYSISEPEENEFVKDIEKLIKKSIPVIDNHPFPQTDKPMTAAEKKIVEKEKNKRKQEFFAARKKNKESGSSSGNKKKFGRR